MGSLGKMCKLSHAQQMARDDTNYEEAQSRLRMSMLCRDCVRPLSYPLFICIIELAVAISDDLRVRLEGGVGESGLRQ